MFFKNLTQNKIKSPKSNAFKSFVLFDIFYKHSKLILILSLIFLFLHLLVTDLYFSIDQYDIKSIEERTS